MTPEELKQRLPPRSFWYGYEIASALRVTPATLQRWSRRRNVGRIVKRREGGRGVKVYSESDLGQLCSRRISNG